MRRALQVLPYVGFALVLVALGVRGLRDEGLALEPFPAPPRLDLVALDMSAPSSSVSGTVVDGEGQPVAEAMVMIVHEGAPAWTYTDPEGRFELIRIPEGDAELEVLAREFRPRKYPVAAPATELLLQLGPRVEPAPTLPALTRENLAGHVVASIRGRDLEGHEVLLVPTAPVHELGAPVPVRAEVGTDRSFRFPALIHGEYRVIVLPPWARGGSWPNLCDPARRAYTHGPSPEKLELPLAAGEIHGRLIDRRGEFIEGGMILLAPESAPEHPWPPAQSDASGSFWVRELPPGTYHLEVYAGEARLEREVLVLAAFTSELDLPPLDVR